jgi:serine/threonine protein phosphatase PrpC
LYDFDPSGMIPTIRQTLKNGMPRVVSGFAEHIGWRPTLEDCSVCVDDIETELRRPPSPRSAKGASKFQFPPQASSVTAKPHSLYAVFDGHAGDECSKFMSERVLKSLASMPSFWDDAQVSATFNASFRSLDDAFRKTAIRMQLDAGSTGVVCLIRGMKVWTANVGDSRAIACKKGKAYALSVDQKPTRSDEKERIERAGGFVEFGRVCGLLAVSRAFGDFEYKEEGKQHIVTVEPDVREFTVDADTEFLVLACDGIWDVLSNQDVCDLVADVRNDSIRKGTWQISAQSAHVLAEAIVNEAIAKRSTDNCTAVVVLFAH